MEQAFANTMREASVSAQQYVQNTNVASLSVDNFVTKQKMAEVSSLAQGKSLGNIKTLLNEYNSSLSATANGVTNCELKQADFVKAVGQSNSVLGKYLSGLNGANASMGGYIGTLIASEAATIGLRIAVTALNSVVAFGFSFAIQKFVEGFNYIIHYAENAANELQDTAKESKQAADAQAEECESLNNLIQKYKELAERETQDSSTRSEIKEIQEDITELVGSQADNLDLVNGKLNEQLLLLQEIQGIELDGAVSSAKKAYIDARDAANNYDWKNANWYSDAIINLCDPDNQIITIDYWGDNKGRNKALDIINKAWQDAGYGSASVGSMGNGLDTFSMLSFDADLNIQERLDALNAAIDALENADGFDYLNNGLWKALVDLRDAVGGKDGVITKQIESANNLLDILLQQTIGSGKKNVNSLDEYIAYRQEIIDSILADDSIKQAINDGVLSDDSITSSIDTYLASLEKYEEYYNQWYHNVASDTAKGIANIKQAFDTNLTHRYGFSSENAAKSKEFSNWIDSLSASNREIVYKISCDTDTAYYSLQDWQNALANYEIPEDDKISFSDLLADEGFTETVDSYIEKVGVLEEAFKSLQDGEFGDSDFIDLVKQFPELADNADDLDSAILDLLATMNTDIISEFASKFGLMKTDEDVAALTNFQNAVLALGEIVGNTSFSINIVAETDGIQAVLTAMKESVSSTGLTADSIKELKARYQDLEGYDAARLFERTANGIHLNTKAFRELESAYETQKKQAINDDLNGLVGQYNDLTTQINETSDAAQKAELYAQRSEILNQIHDTADLAAQYEGLTSAFYKWEQAQSIGEEGDMYDSLSSGLEHIKELFDEGLVGTNEFRAAVQLMTNQDLSTANIDELIAAYNNGYSKMTRYFTDGSDGCLNFLKDVQSLNSEWAHMNEDGSWEINFGIGNDEEIANKLGINVETVQSIMRKLSDYGFDVNLDSEVSQLGYLKTAAEEANDKLKELGKTNYTFNFNTDDVDYLNEEIEEAKKILDTFKKDGKIDFEVDGAEEAQGILATLLYQKQSLETNSVIVQVEISNPDTDIEKVVTTLQKFRSEYNRLKVETEIGADTTEAQANVDALISELKNSNPEILATLGIDTTDSDTVIASIKNLTPEMLVSAGLDASLVEGYDPEDKSSVVTYNYDSSAVDSWKPPTKYGTVIYTATNVGGYVIDKLFGGKSKAQGTAYSNGKYGRYGTKDSGVALVGELGQEMVVRDGEYFTIGDNSAEMFKYEKDDIIFNAEQTRQILENGKITNGVKRGKSYARGTAFSNATGTIYASGSVETNPSGDSSDSKSKDSDDKIEAFDWIEIAIDRIERAIDRLKKTAESTYKALKTKLGATADEITKVNQEIALQQQAYNRYMQEANSIGLDAGLAEKVRNGTIDINQYDEDTRNLISDYQKWYEKALDCSDAIDDLHESLASLYEDNFSNVKDDFENQLTLAEHLTNQYKTGIDMLEARGYLESTKYYAALQDATKGEISILNNELAGLEQAFSDAMNSGEIEKYSEAWYSMQAEINGVKEEIAEANVELAEYAKTMREIEWGYFDYTQERISQITQEADFLIDLLSNSDLHTDKGQLTDEGMTTMGLHGQNYNTYMAQADMYAQEILEIDKELAKDPYNTELIERREELLGLQQDSILAAEDEKQAIVALVEEGINLELQAMQDLIDKYNESLDTAKD